MIHKLKIKLKDEIQSYSLTCPIYEHKELHLSHDDAFLCQAVTNALESVKDMDPTEIKICVEYIW